MFHPHIEIASAPFSVAFEGCIWIMLKQWAAKLVVHDRFHRWCDISHPIFLDLGDLLGHEAVIDLIRRCLYCLLTIFQVVAIDLIREALVTVAFPFVASWILDV